MTTATQIHLDPAHTDLLRTLAEQTGKPADEVVQEGLDLVAERLRLENRRRVFERAFGIWKDRDDLPDIEEMRPIFGSGGPDVGHRMIAPTLFDTDFLIDVLRGHADALAYLAGCTGRLIISVITLAELHAGVRVGREESELIAMLGQFEIIPVDEEIASMGGTARRDYKKSHNLDLDDCLIAATSLREGATLVTLNRKHFPMIPNLIIPYAKP